MRTFFQRSKRRVLALALASLCLLALGTWYFGVFKPAHYKVGAVAPVSAAIPEKSIAVLPFDNQNRDPDTEYLSDGIPESIINSLSQLPNLKVMSRNSVFHYKGKEMDAPAVAKELKVQTVLTGRMTQRGDGLSISVELINAQDNSQIWGQQYNRKLTDVFAVQEEIAKEISEKLRLKLTGAERQQLAKRPTENLRAFQYYLQGRSYINRRTREDQLTAISYYKRAIEEDRNYALAYAGLAEAYGVLGVYGYIAPIDGRRKEEEGARKALALDENLAEAHAVLGQAYVQFAPSNFPLGDRELRRAIELSPSLALAHFYLGVSLTRQGRLDESLEEYLKARELDPLSSIISRQFAIPDYLKRDNARALELLQQANELGPALTTTWEIGIYIQNRLFNEALAELEKAKRERKNDSILIYDAGIVYAAQGKRAEALQTIKELEEMSGASLSQAHWIAKIYATLNEKEQALSWLERGLATGAIGLFYKDEPVWDPIRSDLRFEALVEKMFGRYMASSKQSASANLAAQSASTIPEKSIAVLPFENLSEEKANAYFADGIQEEILTRLAKIADLKVISRTSTQHYKSAPENLPEIARQLGVAHILEGSVQKSGDAVRVNVQLIKAADDSHLWADTYDRRLTDIFSVESEVAKAIADQLRAKLTRQEEQVIAAKPTDNPEAYDAYLRGLAYTRKGGNETAHARAAQKYLREAVRLDPKFALGWALLSYVDASGYRATTLQPTVALREEARQAAETALALQPNLGEAVLAKGYYHYSCLRDYDTAVRYFEQARQLLPNSSLLPMSLAFLERRRGQWDRSESYLNEAERLDPRNVGLLTSHAETYIHLRRLPEAMRKLDQALDITPDDMATLSEKAAIAQAEGDLPRAAAILAPLHPNADDTQTLGTQVYQAILERRPAQIIPWMKEILAKPRPALGYTNGELRFLLGWAQEVAGDQAAAQESWRQARSELEPFLKEQPENSALIGVLALTYMGLGDKAVAFNLIERAMAANPIEKDALEGPASIEILARVAARMGEPDRAVAALQKLLSIPGGGAVALGPLTPALLRLDPMFDPLRNDPRFQKLCEEKPH